MHVLALYFQAENIGIRVLSEVSLHAGNLFPISLSSSSNRNPRDSLQLTISYAISSSTAYGYKKTKGGYKIVPTASGSRSRFNRVIPQFHTSDK